MSWTSPCCTPSSCCLMPQSPAWALYMLVILVASAVFYFQVQCVWSVLSVNPAHSCTMADYEE